MLKCLDELNRLFSRTNQSHFQTIDMSKMISIKFRREEEKKTNCQAKRQNLIDLMRSIFIFERKQQKIKIGLAEKKNAIHTRTQWCISRRSTFLNMSWKQREKCQVQFSFSIENQSIRIEMYVYVEIVSRFMSQTFVELISTERTRTI